MKNLLRSVRTALRRRRHARQLPARKDSLQGSDTQDDERPGLEKVAVVPTTAELASTSTLAAITEETLLVSWLLVLLRAQEDTQFTCEWAFCGGEDGASGEPVSSVSLDVASVVPDLQTTVEQASVAISQHIASVQPKTHASQPRPVSLLLSTGSLTRTPEGTKNDEVSPRVVMTVWETHTNPV